MIDKLLAWRGWLPAASAVWWVSFFLSGDKMDMLLALMFGALWIIEERRRDRKGT